MKGCDILLMYMKSVLERQLRNPIMPVCCETILLVEIHLDFVHTSSAHSSFSANLERWIRTVNSSCVNAAENQ